jgi:hypothetical protein
MPVLCHTAGTGKRTGDVTSVPFLSKGWQRVAYSKQRVFLACLQSGMHVFQIALALEVSLLLCRHKSTRHSLPLCLISCWVCIYLLDVKTVPAKQASDVCKGHAYWEV